MNRLVSRLVEDRWGRGRRDGRAVPALVWLAFILFPLINAITADDNALGRALSLAGAAVFTAAYVWMLLIMFQPGAGAERWLLLAAILVLTILLTLHSPGDWWFLFIYCGACVAVVAPSKRGILAIVALTAFAVATTAVAGGSEAMVISSGTTTIAIGLLMC